MYLFVHGTFFHLGIHTVTMGNSVFVCSSSINQMQQKASASLSPPHPLPTAQLGPEALSSSEGLSVRPGASVRIRRDSQERPRFQPAAPNLPRSKQVISLAAYDPQGVPNFIFSQVLSCCFTFSCCLSLQQTRQVMNSES